MWSVVALEVFKLGEVFPKVAAGKRAGEAVMLPDVLLDQKKLIKFSFQRVLFNI